MSAQHPFPQNFSTGSCAADTGPILVKRAGGPTGSDGWALEWVSITCSATSRPIGHGNPGISWTTDKRIALKFAATGGGRIRVRGGVLLQARVSTIQPGAVLAYITGRDESELIVDPKFLVNVDFLNPTNQKELP